MTQPTIEQLDEYFKQIDYYYPGIGQAFTDYYDKIDWWINKKKGLKMVNWKAACNTWKRNAFEQAKVDKAKRSAVKIKVVESEPEPLFKDRFETSKIIGEVAREAMERLKKSGLD